MIIAVLVCAAPAFGFGPPYPLFNDPLHSMPSTLKGGATLAGDTGPISCPVPKDFSRPLAFDEAVDIALCNNPQIRSAWANIKIQAGMVGEARAAYLPSLTGSLSRAHDRITYPGSNYSTSSIDQTTFQGGITWRIFDFGGRSANHREAEDLLAAALASHNAALQKTLSELAQTYFGAMSAKAALKAAAESEEIAGATLASATARERRGVISQSDRLRATTALAKASLEHNRADGDYRKALAALAQGLGVPGNPTILLPEDMQTDIREIDKDLKGWLEDAQKTHPAIVAARAEVEAAQKQVVVARSAGLPTLNFSGSYYRNTRPGEAVTTNQVREYTVGIGVSIPFFDGFSNTYKVREALARAEQKKAELAGTETQVASDLVKAYIDTDSALRNLDASTNLLRAAQEALVVSQRRYDKGAADITEMLSTQSALSEAQRERIRCLAEWHSARLRLLASAGRMGRSAVRNAVGPS